MLRQKGAMHPLRCTTEKKNDSHDLLIIRSFKTKQAQMRDFKDRKSVV